MKMIQRVKSPTPKFFRTLRTIGLTLAAASAAILTAPISLPAIVMTIAGYAAVAGTVMSAISQTAVDSDDPDSSTLSDDDNGGGSGSVGKI